MRQALTAVIAGWPGARVRRAVSRFAPVVNQVYSVTWHYSRTTRGRWVPAGAVSPGMSVYYLGSDALEVLAVRRNRAGHAVFVTPIGEFTFGLGAPVLVR